MIAGGDGKGQDFAPLAPALGRHGRAVVLIGRDAPLIERVLGACGVPLERCASLEAAVGRADALAQAGDAVLLSPACAMPGGSCVALRGRSLSRTVNSSGLGFQGRNGAPTGRQATGPTARSVQKQARTQFAIATAGLHVSQVLQFAAAKAIRWMTSTEPSHRLRQNGAGELAARRARSCAAPASTRCRRSSGLGVS